jgi:hypothetical protein
MAPTLWEPITPRNAPTIPMCAGVRPSSCGISLSQGFPPKVCLRLYCRDTSSTPSQPLSIRSTLRPLKPSSPVTRPGGNKFFWERGGSCHSGSRQGIVQRSRSIGCRQQDDGGRDTQCAVASRPTRYCWLRPGHRNPAERPNPSGLCQRANQF